MNPEDEDSVLNLLGAAVVSIGSALGTTVVV